MKSNCNNCGAPYRPGKCDYCGTGVAIATRLQYIKNDSRTKKAPDEKLKGWKLWLAVVLGFCIGIVLVALVVKHKKKAAVPLQP